MWTKSLEQRCRQALKQFGFGRWNAIAEWMEVDSLEAEALCSTWLAADPSLCEFLLAKWRETPESTVRPLLDANRIELEPVALSGGQCVTVSLPKQLHVPSKLLICSMDCCVVQRDTNAYDTLTFYAPGIAGLYTVYVIAQGGVGQVKLTVAQTQVHENALAAATSKNMLKALDLAERLQRALNQLERIEKLHLSKPHPNWNAQCNRDLLVGMAKHGTSRFNEIEDDVEFAFTALEIPLHTLKPAALAQKLVDALLERRSNANVFRSFERKSKQSEASESSEASLQKAWNGKERLLFQRVSACFSLNAELVDDPRMGHVSSRWR